MTDATATHRYDFRQPRQLADDVEQVMSRWQSTLAGRLGDAWEKQLGIRSKWKYVTSDSTRLASVAERIADGHLCVKMGYEDQLGTFWAAVPRSFVLGALGVLLGDEVTELPADRELTDVEEAVMDLAWHEFARVLTDSQPCDKPMVCESRQMVRAKDLSRSFTEQEPLVLATFDVEADFGQEQAVCVFSQDAVLQLMTNISECRQVDANTGDDLEDTVKSVPLNVVVRLGGTELYLSDLMNLEPGDVLVLDQRVGEPMSANVGDVTKFRGWPGRLGTRQAFQISQVVVPDHR